MRRTARKLLAVGVLAVGSLTTSSAVAADPAPASWARPATAGASPLAAETPGLIRVGGADRYETAADISRRNWAPTTTFVVFLASGTSTADALALGPSSFSQGPLLLTARDRLPEATRAELERLRPCLLVAVGGTQVLSDAVVAEAMTYVDPEGSACLRN
ncbi:cell wall-binding repeat-containing protein [Kineococcus gynurae]|uniref:Cell wall-binding repeat-containing protein n=1 Tax=Kineococcus gynurae TaxID=452979 RepID=A0ABV5LQ47_9ACTN